MDEANSEEDTENMFPCFLNKKFKWSQYVTAAMFTNWKIQQVAVKL